MKLTYHPGSYTDHLQNKFPKNWYSSIVSIHQNVFITSEFHSTQFVSLCLTNVVFLHIPDTLLWVENTYSVLSLCNLMLF